MRSGQNMVSGSIRACSRLLFFSGKMAISDSGSSPIEFGRAQGCFFRGKMAISDSGSTFLDSGSPPIESGHAQGCFFFWKMATWDSGSKFWDSGSDSQMDLDLDISDL